MDPAPPPPWSPADALGDARAFDALARTLAPSALWSLLLEVARHRAEARAPADVLRQWARDAFTAPSVVDQRTLVRQDARLLDAAAGFEALALSPLAPLATCASVAPASQNKVVTALRGTEVVSDPTNVFALECARRLRAAPDAVVRLATCHQVVRAQQVPRRPGHTQHFHMFALATAARETRDHGATADALAEHLRVLLDAFDALERDGYAFPARTVRLLATPARAGLARRVAATLDGRARVEHAPLEHPYYSGGLRYMLWVRATNGDAVPVGDGGAFDWVAKLTSNRRHAFVASGLGAQLLSILFRPAREG